MPATIHKLPAAMTDSELLAALGDINDAALDPPESGIYATREQRLARYRRLARECDARRARQAFRVVA